MNIYDVTLDHIKQKKLFKYLEEDSNELILVQSAQSVIPENSGYYLISGEVKFNDQTKYPAMFRKNWIILDFFIYLYSCW